MTELIDKGALHEKMQGRYMDRYAGTVRACGFIVAMDMVKDYPATTEAEIRASAIEEFAEKLKQEFDENIFSDEEKFKYDRRTQEAICAQNATWKVAIQYVEKLAEQLKGGV